MVAAGWTQSGVDSGCVEYLTYLQSEDIGSIGEQMKLETKVGLNTCIVVAGLCIGSVACFMGVSREHRVADVLWLASVVAGLLGTLRSLALGKRIARDISCIAERSDVIAAGDFTETALTMVSTREVARLARATNHMQERLREMVGAFTAASSTLAGSADSMRASSDGMHRRIDQQSQQTQQAAAAMTEMSASITEVSRHTQDAAQTARDAAQTAREGGTIVQSVLESMEKIAASVTEASTSMGHLGRDSMKISQIVTVIDDIAKKTNLLALNAAIEAARAGEQGRGFAVVAVEVRRLAVSTAKATGEISSMIENIQQRASAAIANTEAGTALFSEGVATTKQAGSALERIIGMAERVDRMIAQIAIATAQQAAASDQSSASLDAIHALSGENLNDMATTAQGIEALRSAAVEMEAQVERSFVEATPERLRKTRSKVRSIDSGVHAGWV